MNTFICVFEVTRYYIGNKVDSSKIFASIKEAESFIDAFYKESYDNRQFTFKIETVYCSK